MKEAFLKIKENRWTSIIVPFVVLLGIGIIFSLLTNGRFSNENNLRLILNQALITGTVATGAVFIYSTGNVNIAMGASTAVAATIGAMIYVRTGSVSLMVIAAMAAGIIVMYFSSLMSVIFKVRVLFVTVVMMGLLSALQQTLLNGDVIKIPYSVYGALKDANVPYIIFGVFFLICFVVFNLTKIGRSVKFIGSNESCAELTGIFTNKYLQIAFFIAGIGVGAGAILTIIRTGNVNNATAASLNMDVMLAIVLGGMPIFGGSKSKIHAGIIGAITVAVLNSGLLMVGVSNTLLQGVRGIIFMVLVIAALKRPDGLPSRL